jgi:hypothetical protein
MHGWRAAMLGAGYARAHSQEVVAQFGERVSSRTCGPTNRRPSHHVVQRGERCRAHRENLRRIGLWSDLGYWRTRSNHSGHSNRTDRASRAEFLAPKYQGGAPGLVHDSKALHAMSGECCIQWAGCLPWLPYEVPHALLTNEHKKRNALNSTDSLIFRPLTIPVDNSLTARAKTF